MRSIDLHIKTHVYNVTIRLIGQKSCTLFPVLLIDFESAWPKNHQRYFLLQPAVAIHVLFVEINLKISNKEHFSIYLFHKV